MINGVTWPIPKKNKKIIDIVGFLACDTQARRVAKTGVMQGEEASPKVVTMATVSYTHLTLPTKA